MNLPKTSGIYMIRNTSTGKCYIGQSDNVKRRVDAHERALRHNKHYNKYLQRSWNMHGADHFEFLLIEECSVDSLDEREVFYIDRYGAYTDGYNLNFGGGSNRGYVHSEESKQKIRDSHWNCSGENNPMYGHSVKEFMTDEEIDIWKKNISRALSGSNNPIYGKKHSDETKRKIGESHKGLFVGEKSPMYGKRMTREQVERMKASHAPFYARNRGANHTHAKRVVCLNSKTVYGSISDAERSTGVNHSAISICCSGKIRSAGIDIQGQRLVWAHYDEYLKMSNEEITKRISEANTKRSGENSPVSKAVICLTTGELFASARIASAHYGVDNSSLCKVCRGLGKTCGKDPVTGERLRWAFYNELTDDVANHT